MAHGVKGFCRSVAQNSAAYDSEAPFEEGGRVAERLDAVARLQAFVAAHEEELTASTEAHECGRSSRPS